MNKPKKKGLLREKIHIFDTIEGLPMGMLARNLTDTQTKAS
jgi:hypothetical protein